jgi:hypothetical protein
MKKSSVAVACFLLGRAKDLSAPMWRLAVELLLNDSTLSMSEHCVGPRFYLWFVYYSVYHTIRTDWDSSVGIATRYGLDGPGIESRWGEIFRTRPDRPWGPRSLLYSGFRVCFPGVKRTGRDVDHPPLSSAEVKERVRLYIYSASGSSWPVLGRPLPLSYFNVL